MQINSAFMRIYIHLDEHNYFSVILACRYKLKSNNGSFTSSRTPSLIYPDFQNCSWLVTVNETLLISLIFTSIRVPNCKENFIDIYDGRDETFPLLARYCGSNAIVGNKLKSTGNKLYLVFKTGNNSLNGDMHTEFHANYTTHLIPERKYICRSSLLSIEGFRFNYHYRYRYLLPTRR